MKAFFKKIFSHAKPFITSQKVSKEEAASDSQSGEGGESGRTKKRFYFGIQFSFPWSDKAPEEKKPNQHD